MYEGTSGTLEQIPRIAQSRPIVLRILSFSPPLKSKNLGTRQQFYLNTKGAAPPRKKSPKLSLAIRDNIPPTRGDFSHSLLASKKLRVTDSSSDHTLAKGCTFFSSFHLSTLVYLMTTRLPLSLLTLTP